MASITIRQLDDDLKRRLRLRAARNGRSMEDEVRTILRGAAVAGGPAETQRGGAPRQAAAASRLPSAPIDRTLADRRILLIIGGGIAAYKSLDLIRRLKERGAAVRCVLTAAAKHFVTPLSVASLSEDKVYDDLWSLTDESEMGHIRLSREADLVVVAPASADLIARIAAGLADDLATTALLASDKPVLIAPT